MSCSACKQKNTEPVSYIAFESSMARLERVNRRLWIISLVLILLFCVSNAIWILRESQYAEEIITQTVETNQGNAYVSGAGDINYGQSKAND